MPFWYGWQGGWPLQWGGGPSQIEKINAALFASVGRGHAAEQDGIEWLWRQSRAAALASISLMAERAVAQHDPALATDALPYYRELFALPDSLGDQLAREAADDRYHTQPAVDVPSVVAKLQRIDSRFSIVERPWSASATTINGRAFEDWDQALPYGIGRGDTVAPNYSNALDLVVLFDITDAPTGPLEAAALSAARDYLDDVLPSWVDYSIMGSSGFVLDQSPLDWTGFDP
jgi:hypothetical protein